MASISRLGVSIGLDLLYEHAALSVFRNVERHFLSYLYPNPDNPFARIGMTLEHTAPYDTFTCSGKVPHEFTVPSVLFRSIHRDLAFSFWSAFTAVIAPDRTLMSVQLTSPSERRCCILFRDILRSPQFFNDIAKLAAQPRTELLDLPSYNALLTEHHLLRY